MSRLPEAADSTSHNQERQTGCNQRREKIYRVVINQTAPLKRRTKKAVGESTGDSRARANNEFVPSKWRSKDKYPADYHCCSDPRRCPCHGYCAVGSGRHV